MKDMTKKPTVKTSAHYTPDVAHRTHADFMGAHGQEAWLTDLFDRHDELIAADVKKNADDEARYQAAYESAAPGFYDRDRA